MERGKIEGLKRKNEKYKEYRKSLLGALLLEGMAVAFGVGGTLYMAAGISNIASEEYEQKRIQQRLIEQAFVDPEPASAEENARGEPNYTVNGVPLKDYVEGEKAK